MKARYVVRLFLTTFFVGGIAAVVTGMAVNRGEFAQYFADFAGKKFFAGPLVFAVGLLFSAISQMGFSLTSSFTASGWRSLNRRGFGMRFKSS